MNFDLTVVNLQAGHLVHPSNLNRWDSSNSTLYRRWHPLRSTCPTTEGVSDHGGSRVSKVFQLTGDVSPSMGCPLSTFSPSRTVAVSDPIEMR